MSNTVWVETGPAREIHLHGKHGEGKVALCSPEDFDYLNQFIWRIDVSGGNKSKKTGYVCRGKKYTGMHVEVLSRMGLVGVPDHIDPSPESKLDNRRSNLRPANAMQNGANRELNDNNTSGYKGVSKSRCRQLWRAGLCFCNIDVHVGYYMCKHDAARAYDEAAENIFGPFANNNARMGLIGKPICLCDKCVKEKSSE